MRLEVRPVHIAYAGIDPWSCGPGEMLVLARADRQTTGWSFDARFTITDEDLSAMTTDGDLDAATERAAQAWGVVAMAVHVRSAMVTDDPESAYCAQIEDFPGDPYGYGPTRLAALEALAAQAKPKLPDLASMTINELADEANRRLGSGTRSDTAVAQARRGKHGKWRVFSNLATQGFILGAGEWHDMQIAAWREAVAALRARDGEAT